jgi:putative transcriptional regulator
MTTMHHTLRRTTPDESGRDAGSRFLTGKLLAAMPSMSDPRFAKALIFLCAHDANGAMGIAINNELTNIPLSLLLSQLSLPTADDFEDFPVLQGGPVETARGLLLHSSDVLKTESIRIDRDFAVTGTIEALREIVAGVGPHDKLFALGYAGWGPGQLEAEIADNAWLVIDSDPDLVFRTPPSIKWEKAIRKLGVDPAFLAGSAGHA